MRRYITLLDEAGNLELTLPVTPASYSWPHEAVIETVTVDQLGDLNFWGGKKMGSTTLPDCLLPAHAYPFLTPGAGTNPWAYVEQLERWIDAGTVLRLLVSGTPVNAAVLLEGLHYREQDGTNDLYADITLRQYQQPETPVTPAQQTGSTAATRPSATGASTTRSYTVVSGDTMWGICRKFYGDGSLAWRLAAANGVDLVIGGVAWCKDAGGSGVDRMVVYVNDRRFVKMDELSPLARVMTGPVPTLGAYDSMFKANISEVELFYETSMLYVDGI